MNNRVSQIIMTRRPPLFLILGMVGLLFFSRAPIFSDDLSSPEIGDVAVVTSPIFVPTLKRWVTYRQSQGYRVHLLVQNAQTDGNALLPTPESIRNQIRVLAAQVPLKAILLVGDGAALAGQSTLPDDPLGSASSVIPAPRITAKTIDQFGPENHIASDGWFADLDDDTLPELAVGRLPVRTPKQLDDAIDKILYYEKMIPSGDWQRKISFIAGMAGFSLLLDNVINNAIRQTLAATVPDDYDFLLAQANWKSPYCPDPILFRFTTIDQINQGPLFWVYMGHGLNQELDRLITPEGDFKILELADVRYVNCPKSLPIMIFCACYTGAYDSTAPSLAEEFFLTPRGPIAVLASSRTSMPYGMAVFGVEMIEEIFQRSESPDSLTLGELVTAAKRRMRPLAPVKEKVNTLEAENAEEDILTDSRSKTRRSLDELAKMFDPTAPELDGQLEDHRNLFNLFGDPLLRIHFPKRLTIQTPEIGYASEKITISSEGIESSSSSSDWSPSEGDENRTKSEGSVLVELVCLPTRPKVRDANRHEFSLTDSDRIEFQRTFEKANDRIVTSVSGTLQNGKFAVELAIPPDTFGTFIVRALVSDQGQTITGAKRIKIRKRTESTATE